VKIRNILAVPVLAALLALGACGSDSSSDSSDGASSSGGSAPAVDSPFAGKTLKIATDAKYPPCEFKKEGSDKIVGFDADIWNGVAERLGAKIEVEDTQFDSLLTGVESGRYDFVVGCFSDNAEREKVVDFVNYIYAETSVITTADSDTPINDTDPLSVCGETMGAQNGFDTTKFVEDTISPACEKDGKDPVKIQTYPSAADTYSALYSGRVDFIILDTAAGAYLNQNSPTKLTLHANSLLSKLYLGIPVAKDNKELSSAILSALELMFKDGSYQKILDTWDIPSLGLEKPGINLATSDPIPAAG
jgi:polar amino acid transport system substrate-binding protein